MIQQQKNYVTPVTDLIMALLPTATSIGLRLLRFAWWILRSHRSARVEPQQLQLFSGNSMNANSTLNSARF
jgi:hypothetical protein